MNIIIAGYGNVGRHIFEELHYFNPKIYDPYFPEYSKVEDTNYDLCIICVPTNMLSDGKCDTSAVESVINTINANIYMIRSTVAVGTTESIVKKTEKQIVFSPEYQGTTAQSEGNRDFLVLGGDKQSCAEIAQIYYKIKNQNFRIVFTDSKTAELAKYMENCFLALKVTFCCEFADIAESFGISYPELREIFILDERMGSSHTYVHPDTPYYDSICLNKDIPALLESAKDNSVIPLLMETVNLINKLKKP